MMRRNLQQTIRKSVGRYLAIVAIIALGAGLFCGLRVTKVDMVATVQDFTDRQNMFDVQVLGTFGWTEDNLKTLAAQPGIADAEGGIAVDALLHGGDHKDQAYRLISIPETVNQVSLVAGRMPQAPNECLADNFFNTEDIIGQEIHVSPLNEETTLDMLSCDSYTVVGLAATPLYLNMQRGSTSIGTGTIADYFYLPREGFDADFYTEINLTLPGDYAVYTDEYDDAMDDMAEHLETLCAPLADARRDEVLAEAEAEYADGKQEYEDGLREFETQKADALRQLADAEQELRDGEEEIRKNRQALLDGKIQLSNGFGELRTQRLELMKGKQELAREKVRVYEQLNDAREELDANYEKLSDGLSQVNDGIAQMESGLAQIDAGLDQIDAALAQIDDGLRQLQMGISQLESAISQINEGLAQLETMLPLLNSLADTAQKVLDYLDTHPLPQLPELPPDFPELPDVPDLPRPDAPAFVEQLRLKLLEIIAQRDEAVAKQQELTAMREELTVQLEQARQQQAELTETRAELAAQREELQAQKDALMPQYRELLDTRDTLMDGMRQVNDGYNQYYAGRSEADLQFADAEVQLAEGQVQLEQAQNLLTEKQQELRDGEKQLQEAETDLEAGKLEFADKKAEVLQEIDDAQAELDDAAVQLADARSEIDSIDEASVYALTRNTNLGYVVFESDSDIIAGIAKIFPVFFLSVAALVCITTMTRMVDEERTQIGVLKALGYSSGAIMGKYMAYSGSAALIGCATGVVAGSIVFPKILWKAYCIMYGFNPHVTLTFDWGTYAAIVLSYTALTLFVTWYCCHRELANVPAQLIRPKPPAAGKSLLMERLPFWKHLSFLNKVAIRNIFRYHQRLAMMLLGIGGCTALLVTGFGIKDSISGIVDYQFESVIQYDSAVTFDQEQTPELQQAFLDEFGDLTDDVLFCHKSSIDLLYNDQVKNLNFLVTDKPLDGFISLHKGEQPLSMPGQNEALVSEGVAEVLDIHEGDEITLRNSDLQELKLTVSGVFDNHVFNYVIVDADTVAGQWGAVPEVKNAFVRNGEGRETHEVGGAIAGFDGVLNVEVNQDTADQVYGMMDAMDSIVLLVVFCAGLLATIVLYNLTNINIKERIREIATIKVLGFNALESASYVFKENLALTFMGMILGLGGGKLLHAAVMSFVRIDMVWFDSVIHPVSYLLAALLTVVAAFAVDFVMYFQLEKINMAEALKSVE